MPRALNVLLVAEESAGIRVLRAVSQGEHRLVAVVAAEHSHTGAAGVWDAAQRMGYVTWPAREVKDPDFAGRVRGAEIDILLNVHSLYVLPEPVITAPRIGSFNLHPGPLPQYAGLNAPSWAIYHGEKTHGVTVHQMTPDIDAGPVVYQARFPIADGDTGLSVALKCVQLGVPLVLKLLEVVAEDPAGLPLTAQRLEDRHYFGRAVPQNGRVDWARPARDVWNFVRACDYAPFPSPWGCPVATLEGEELGIVKVAITGECCSVPHGTIREGPADRVFVACADEWIEVSKVMVDDEVVGVTGKLRDGSRFDVER